MLQVNPANRPDIKEVLTGLEAIAIAMDVELKGKVVSSFKTLKCRAFYREVFQKFQPNFPVDFYLQNDDIPQPSSGERSPQGL